MKIEVVNTVNTVIPERRWTKGEIVEVSIKVGQKLLSNPNFREVKEVSRSKTRRKRK